MKKIIILISFLLSLSLFASCDLVLNSVYDNDGAKGTSATLDGVTEASTDAFNGKDFEDSVKDTERVTESFDDEESEADAESDGGNVATEATEATDSSDIIENSSDTTATTDGSGDSDTITEIETVFGNTTDSITDEETEIDSEEETVSPYLAPDFTVYDVNGNEVKLSDYRGKPIVLNFWARDCIYCTREMPDFQNMYEKYGDRVEFLMVCFTSFSNRGIEYEKEYIETNGYTFPVYYDTSDSAVSAYGISSIPQTFFIDSNFDLYTYIPGMASEEALETCIGYILK